MTAVRRFFAYPALVYGLGKAEKKSKTQICLMVTQAATLETRGEPRPPKA